MKRKHNISLWLVSMLAIMVPLLLFAGGRPSKGTKKDMRLTRNKPKPAAAPAKPAMPKAAKPGKMMGY